MKLDNRGLEPPEPMVRTLEQLENMPDDEVLYIINDRRSIYLYPELETRGYDHETRELEDGSFEIKIFKSK